MFLKIRYSIWNKVYLIQYSLRSRLLEVVGEWENRRARGGAREKAPATQASFNKNW